LDAVLGCAGEGGLDAEEGFHDGLGIGDREADAEGHEAGKIEEGLHPRFGEEDALADEIERGDRKCGRGEERQIDDKHLEPALQRLDDGDGNDERRHDNHERVREIGREVVDGFNLLLAGDGGFPDEGQALFAALDEAFGPARLLGFEGGHLDGQLGGALDVWEVFELPAG
jgi:hypothetical protein